MKIDVERKIQSENDRLAQKNRRVFSDAGVFVVNIISSPGSGKTTLLEATLDRLAGKLPITVIEGDVSTERDMDRVRARGASGVQINTGGGCHLSAAMVGEVLGGLDLKSAEIVFIENVGNLICPSTYDLGEDVRMVLLSTTEGDDKPMKYPAIFHEASLAVINKMDLLPHLIYDLEKVEREIEVLNANCEILRLSAVTGDGMDGWIDWIMRKMAEKKRALHREAS
ncbi:MAG: hydrogenase nickel incorporation protein HypB [Candidatus Eisenbacteria bacterium]|nr:hydrogenase nickel incorporation protein HypB [Candidatus Eisenbacteria bacterium]